MVFLKLESHCACRLSPALQFTAYMKEIKAQEQEAARLDAVFPCVLQVCVTPGNLHSVRIVVACCCTGILLLESCQE